jgi:hypothetical protein
MFNEHGEHDHLLIVWTLTALAFGVLLVAVTGG